MIEDVAELRIAHPHVVSLEARQPNLEGAGGVGLDRLVREALRMRPDRLVVGECRGAEVRELLAALNTGHDGGAGTLHANSLEDVPARLEALGALAGLTPDAVGRQAVSAFDAVLHLVRDRTGRRLAAIGRLCLDRGGRLGVVELGSDMSRRDDRTRFEETAAAIARLAVLLDAGVAPASAWRHVAAVRMPRRAPRSSSPRRCRTRPRPRPAGTAPRRGGRRAGRASRVGGCRRRLDGRERVGSAARADLARLAGVLRSLAQAAREVEVALAGPVATARIILVLPAVGLASACCSASTSCPSCHDPSAGPASRSASASSRRSRWNRRMVQSATRRRRRSVWPRAPRDRVVRRWVAPRTPSASSIGLSDAGLAAGDGPMRRPSRSRGGRCPAPPLSAEAEKSAESRRPARCDAPRR